MYHPPPTRTSFVEFETEFEGTSEFHHHLTLPRDRMVPQDTIRNYIRNQIRRNLWVITVRTSTD